MVSQHMQELQNFKTRYSYAPQAWDSVAYAYSKFESYGLAVEYFNFSTGAYDMRNVIGTLPGALNLSSPVYIVSAHIDSTSFSPYLDAPGADDDGSGTAGLIAAAEILSDYRFNYTIKFVAFSGEEQGLLGSKAYSKYLSEHGYTVGGVLNLDMIGYNPAGDNRVRSRANLASMDLANFTHNISVKYSETGIDGVATLDASTNSDHAPFWNYGWDAINFIEYNFGLNPNYHKPTDTIGYLNMTYLANTTQLTVACAAELAQIVSADAKGPTTHPLNPLPGGYGNETPVISAVLADPAGVNITRARLYVEGFSVLYNSSIVPAGYNISYRVLSPYSDGQVVHCRVVAFDMLGNNVTKWWNFTVDAVSPGPPTPMSLELYRSSPDKQGLAFDLGPGGTYDGSGAMSPSAIKVDGEYKMWYACYDGATYRIAYANSSNGRNWTKQGVVLDVSATGPDSRHLGDCSVLRNGGEYKMWYSGYNGTSYRILFANSTDGLTWVKRGVVLDLGSPGSLDDRTILTPSVIWTGSEYRMWYAGSDGVNYRILYATSANGLNWTRKGTAIGPGRMGDFDSLFLQGPTVVQYKGGYLCWYTGYDGSRYRTLKAKSSDGLNWTKLGLAIELGSAGSYETVSVSYPSAFVEGNSIHLWYTGSDGRSRVLYSNESEETPGTKKTSVLLKFAASPSSDVTRTEVYLGQNWTDCKSPGEARWKLSQSTSYAHVGAGAGNATSYYYAFRATDRVGHKTVHWIRAAKVAVPMAGGYVPVGSPFSNGMELGARLESASWTSAMAWNATDPVNRWETNFTERPWYMNDLKSSQPLAGFWLNAGAGNVFVSLGIVTNNSLQLRTGWNLVAFPHIKAISYNVAIAEIGGACSRIEGYDQAATYKLKVLGASDSLEPGRAYWLYMSSDTLWAAADY